MFGSAVNESFFECRVLPKKSVLQVRLEFWKKSLRMLLIKLVIFQKDWRQDGTVQILSWRWRIPLILYFPVFPISTVVIRYHVTIRIYRHFESNRKTTLHVFSVCSLFLVWRSRNSSGQELLCVARLDTNDESTPVNMMRARKNEWLSFANLCHS